VRTWHEVNAWRRGPGKNATPILSEVESILTYTSTIPKITPASTPELCGIKRYMSIGETTSDDLRYIHSTQISWDIPRPTELPNWDISRDHRPAGPIGFPSEPFSRPACEIHRQDCPKQWELFREYFRDWTITLDQIDAEAWASNFLCSNVLNGGNGGLACAVDRPYMNTTRINFDLFLAWRGAIAYTDIPERTFPEQTFLNGCSPAIQNQCLVGDGFAQVQKLMLGYGIGEDVNVTASNKVAQAIHTSIPANTSEGSSPGCSVETDQFVLIYFPTISNASRDICANDGWGENVPEVALNHNHTVTKTATLDQIVFESRGECKLSFDNTRYITNNIMDS
jgi:hypothetical protein